MLNKAVKKLRKFREKYGAKLRKWRERYGAMGAAKAILSDAQKHLGWFPPGRNLLASMEKQLYLHQQRLDFELFDAKYGTDTGGVIPLADLKLMNGASPECIWYEAASPVIFRQLMAALDISFADFEFVDYGCGKGRMLMLAAEQGFRKATGVEFAAALVEIARSNAEIFNRGCANPAVIESVHIDAVDYVLPDVPLVLFFYAPFKGTVLDRVLANITTSYVRAPRPLILVFHGRNRRVIEKFHATGFVSREVLLQRDPTRFIHYRGFIFTAPNRSP
jgi:hypothetical protein